MAVSITVMTVGQILNDDEVNTAHCIEEWRLFQRGLLLHSGEKIQFDDKSKKSNRKTLNDVQTNVYIFMCMSYPFGSI